LCHGAVSQSRLHAGDDDRSHRTEAAHAVCRSDPAWVPGDPANREGEDVMNSPALLAIAFTISLFCAGGSVYLVLRSRLSQQRIRRGLESAVGENDVSNSTSAR